MKRIRSILLLPHFPPDFAGGGLQASRLMEQLGSRGVEMRALTMRSENSRGPRRERAFGGEVIRFRVFGGPLQRDIMLSIRAGWWLLVHSGWDLLHCSGFSYFGVLPMLAAKLKGKPVLIKTTVLGDKGAFNPGASWPARTALGSHANADVFVALSEALEDDLRAREEVNGRILQIPNGVDTGLFRPARGDEQARLREAFGLPRDGVLIATCCMLYPRKNVIALLRAAVAMKARPVCVVMAGPPGPDSDYLERLDEAIATLPEGVDARRLGALEPERLADLLRASDVYALMSRAEGLPNTLLEAMSTGLACVASDIPGSADVLADGGGLLVPLDDDSRLAAEFDRLAGDPALRGRMGAEARERILEHYSFAGVAGRYRALYDEMLCGRSHS